MSNPISNTTLSEEIPLACDLSVLSPDERERHGQVTAQIQARCRRVVELDDGYALELPADSLALAAEFIAREHRCCPFFRLVIDVEPGQHDAMWLQLRGSASIKDFVRQEFGLATP